MIADISSLNSLNMPSEMFSASCSTTKPINILSRKRSSRYRWGVIVKRVRSYQWEALNCYKNAPLVMKKSDGTVLNEAARTFTFLFSHGPSLCKCHQCTVFQIDAWHISHGHMKQAMGVFIKINIGLLYGFIYWNHFQHAESAQYTKKEKMHF